jgi:hypothetical protein
MSPHTLSRLRRLEGHHVALELADGSRIEDCELVSAGPRRDTVWVLQGDVDRFVRVADIADLWETA